MWKRIVSPSPESATRVPHKPNRPLNILLVVADDQPLGAKKIPAIAAAVAGILLNLVFLILDDVIGRPEPTPPAPTKTEDAA